MSNDTKALVVDQRVLLALASAVVEDEWFSTFHVPQMARQLKRFEKDGYIYILSEGASESSRLLVIRTGKNGVFAKAKSPRHVFDRILHVALSKFDAATFIPVKWKSYHENALLSVYAQPEAIAPSQRVYFDQAPQNTNHLFAYALTDTVEQFDKVPKDPSVFRAAIDHYVDALLAPNESTGSEATHGIVLSEPLGSALFGAGSLGEWYDRKLTADQRRFVDRDDRAPVRLKGPAGSGKTAAMAVKCLRDAYRLEDDKRASRIAFITHSSALAHDVLPGMFFTLDPTGPGHYRLR
jgi:hypothetical protein